MVGWLSLSACLLLLIHTPSGVSGLHCSCEGAKCTELSPGACLSGTTKDLCGCCTVCAGNEGEECGGPWGIYGECGAGLECHQDHCPQGDQTLECYHYYLTEPGVCVEQRPRSPILEALAGPDRGGLDSKQHRRQRLLRQLELLMK